MGIRPERQLDRGKKGMNPVFHINLFYRIKPLIPRRLQICLRRLIANQKRKISKDSWPILRTAAKAPEGWTGWPDHKQFALIVQHDVDTIKGVRNCLRLMEMDRRWGFRSSFNFVQEDYAIPPSLARILVESGFEIGIHGLKHDGKLFLNREAFYKNVPRINYYLRKWGAFGLTSPSMLRNMNWMAELDIEHGCSTFDTDPFEPQSDGAGTIFPFYAGNNLKTRSYVELPYTLPQDHGLFIILKEKDIRIWKEKLDWIVENGGMAVLNSHPDYMNFEGTPNSFEEYPVSYYSDFLEYIQSRYAGRYWHVLPRDMARFWKEARPLDVQRKNPQEKRSKLLVAGRLIQEKQKFDERKVKIWIDLDNTPHVPFFIPIIRELERRGHKVVLSARDAFQVCDLAEKKNLSYVKIGRHYGKNKVRKLFGLLWRSVQLVPFFFRQRPGLALTHGSRSQLLLSNLFRIPTLLAVDYEHSKTIPLSNPLWMIMAEALSGEMMMAQTKYLRFYRGIKEDVYVPEFKPDPSLLNDLGLNPDDLIVTVRPPADEAHYYNPESDILLLELMALIVRTPGIRAVLLPRNYRQEAAMRKKHPEWFADDRTRIPTRVVDGLDLLWYSDLVVSGGGTMNREAAAMGIPVYSIFRGTTGAVDLRLEQEGRLIMIRSVEEIGTKIRFVRRDKSRRPDNHPREALKDIVDYIEEIIHIERVRPYRPAKHRRSRP
jgi:predicted glycosyltransferase/peptidoglycan/xylan/chitin deacetylase (PgdA/CDA1 family)